MSYWFLELTWHYNCELLPDRQVTCHCGSKNCRGRLFWKEKKKTRLTIKQVAGENLELVFIPSQIWIDILWLFDLYVLFTSMCVCRFSSCACRHFFDKFLRLPGHFFSSFLCMYRCAGQIVRGDSLREYKEKKPKG